MTAATEPLIGVINAGSSSLKFSFYEGERRILSGQVEGIGARPSASATGPDGEKIMPADLGAKPPTVPSEVLPTILPWAKDRLGDRRLAAVGHRVVHGGPRERLAASAPLCLCRHGAGVDSGHCRDGPRRRGHWRSRAAAPATPRRCIRRTGHETRSAVCLARRTRKAGQRPDRPPVPFGGKRYRNTRPAAIRD